MQKVLSATNDWRESVELYTPIYYLFLSGQTKGFFVNGSQGLMYGLIWRSLQRMQQVRFLPSYRVLQIFIIGNYSDGNLVAALLSCKMGVTQCNIAHALEKTKHPDSDLYCENLSYQSKPMIFSIARLDRVKIIMGLVAWYAKNTKLRELANLVVVAGYNNVKRSSYREEISEIEKIHDLFKKYKLVRFDGFQAKQTVLKMVNSITILLMVGASLYSVLFTKHLAYGGGGHDLWPPNVCNFPWWSNEDNRKWDVWFPY